MQVPEALVKELVKGKSKKWKVFVDGGFLLPNPALRAWGISRGIVMFQAHERASVGRAVVQRLPANGAR
jgi:hypothetical protein